MNNLKYFILLLISLPIITLHLTNCTSDNGNPLSPNESALVGTWDLSTINMTYQGETEILLPTNLSLIIVLIFESDRTWDLTQTVTTTGDFYNSHGSWSLSGSNIILNASGSAPTLTLSYSASGDDLIMEASETIEGEIISYEYYFTKR